MFVKYDVTSTFGNRRIFLINVQCIFVKFFIDFDSKKRPQPQEKINVAPIMRSLNKKIINLISLKETHDMRVCDRDLHVSIRKCSTYDKKKISDIERISIYIVKYRIHELFILSLFRFIIMFFFYLIDFIFWDKNLCLYVF